MPVTTFLFARAEPALEAALLAHPRWSRAAFRLDAAAAGLEGPAALLAVDLADAAFDALWDHQAEPEAPELPVLLEARRRFPWLDRVLPPPAEVQALLALAAERPLAWFYWWERGDDLYADAALLLGPGRQVALARETALLGTEGAGAWALESGRVEPLAWDGSPFQSAMSHLGLRAGTQYFVPADSGAFPWASYRLPNVV